jgi:hypothetical protein
MAGLKGVGSEIVKDAYAQLSGALQGHLSALSALLHAPEDAEHIKAATEELRDSGLAEDADIMQAAQKLTDSMERDAKADPARWAILIERVRAANVLIRQVKSTDGGVVVRHVRADSDVRIEGISVGGREKN